MAKESLEEAKRVGGVLMICIYVGMKVREEVTWENAGADVSA